MWLWIVTDNIVTKQVAASPHSKRGRRISFSDENHSNQKKSKRGALLRNKSSHKMCTVRSNTMLRPENWFT